MIDLKKNYQIMGIVNTTPDSFSDGGSYTTVDVACQHALHLLEAGADILDIGGQSTRPGYEEVSPQVEADRVLPLIKKIRETSLTPISVDTYYPQVAEAAIQAGATIINDIKGLDTPGMAEVLAQYPEVQVVIMHSRKHQSLSLKEELHQFYTEKIEQCQKYGLSLEKICFDPGIGFHKTVAENLQLLKDPNAFRYQDYPLLYGVSRKIYVRKMDKYKHLLLWSTLLLSFFQVTTVQAAEERNPIYNPTNPTEEIYPIENTGTPEKMEETNESTITSDTQAEESSEDVSKKEVKTNNPKTNEERPSSKKSQHQVFFTDELFDASHITIVPNSTGGAGTEGQNTFYLNFIRELVGTAIYGRKN